LQRDLNSDPGTRPLGQVHEWVQFAHNKRFLQLFLSALEYDTNIEQLQVLLLGK